MDNKKRKFRRAAAAIIAVFMMSATSITSITAGAVNDETVMATKRTTTAESEVVTDTQTDADTSTPDENQTTSVTTDNGEDDYNNKQTTTSKNYKDQTVATTKEPTKTTQKTNSPASVKLIIGSVKNGLFTVKVNITSDADIAAADIDVSFDSSLITYQNYSASNKIVGTTDVTSSAKKVNYSYQNSNGTDYDGNYVALTFKVKDSTMSSAALYIKVNSLADASGTNIPASAVNGIVTNEKVEQSSAVDETIKDIEILYSTEPRTPESIGLKNVKSCEIYDTTVLKFENGSFYTLKAGKTQVKVNFKSGKSVIYNFIVSESADSSEAVVADTSSEINFSMAAGTTQTNDNNTMKNIIVVVALLLVAVIAAAFLVITRKGRKESVEIPIINDFSGGNHGNTENENYNSDYENLKLDDDNYDGYDELTEIPVENNHDDITEDLRFDGSMESYDDVQEDAPIMNENEDNDNYEPKQTSKEIGQTLDFKLDNMKNKKVIKNNSDNWIDEIDNDIFRNGKDNK